MPASIFRPRSNASSRSTTSTSPGTPPSTALPLTRPRNSKPRLKLFWKPSTRKNKPTVAPAIHSDSDSIAVPSRVQSLITTLSSLDHQLEATTWAILTHRTRLSACTDVASTSALLKNDHQRLLLRLADVRRGFEESGCSLYLLVKIGVFAEAWNDYDEQDGSVLREMVQERLERLARYLKEDLEDAEEQMKEAETECLERVLRPAGLELSLLF